MSGLEVEQSKIAVSVSSTVLFLGVWRNLGRAENGNSNLYLVTQRLTSRLRYPVPGSQVVEARERDGGSKENQAGTGGSGRKERKVAGFSRSRPKPSSIFRRFILVSYCRYYRAPVTN